MTDIRKESCLACPYRRDVPSGVWAAQEYEKLAEYDRETYDQPMGAFHCHATPEVICHGWTVVHGRQDYEHEPIAFRMWGIDPDSVEEHTPLFSSGTEACEHGKHDILHPSPEAREVVARLMDKYDRLQWS
jgi:hypothetical protein